MIESPLARVALLFLWIGVVSFGGGLAVVPELHHQLVDRHAWLTAREFTDGIVVGQLAPGPNMLAVVFYGARLAGVLGGLTALLAAFAPGAILSALCARAWTRLAHSNLLALARKGLVPVGVGLMIGGVLLVARGALVSLGPAVVALVVAVVVERRWLHPALAVLLAGAVGLALAF